MSEQIRPSGGETNGSSELLAAADVYTKLATILRKHPWQTRRIIKKRGTTEVFTEIPPPDDGLYAQGASFYSPGGITVDVTISTYMSTMLTRGIKEGYIPFSEERDRNGLETGLTAITVELKTPGQQVGFHVLTLGALNPKASFGSLYTTGRQSFESTSPDTYVICEGDKPFCLWEGISKDPDQLSTEPNGTLITAFGAALAEDRLLFQEPMHQWRFNESGEPVKIDIPQQAQ